MTKATTIQQTDKDYIKASKTGESFTIYVDGDLLFERKAKRGLSNRGNRRFETSLVWYKTERGALNRLAKEVAKRA